MHLRSAHLFQRLASKDAKGCGGPGGTVGLRRTSRDRSARIPQPLWAKDVDSVLEPFGQSSSRLDEGLQICAVLFAPRYLRCLNEP
jgi:hypothetical protein